MTFAPSFAEPTTRPDSAMSDTGSVTGTVRLFLRGEGAAVLIASGAAYHALDGTAATFALLFLVPDIAMLGYLAGPRVGANAYNLAHSYVTPAALALVVWLFGPVWAYPLLLVWVAHIGFDRLMGYGLKYPTAFGATHLGWRGRKPKG